MRRIININKGWKLIKDGVRTDIDLPFTPDADAAGAFDRGMTGYEKYLEAIPEGRVMLEFEGVNSVCEAQINCVKLGSHKGGYSKFRYDITESVRHDSVLMLAVSNSRFEDVYPETADFTFYSGIYRNVNLIITGETRFSSGDYASDGLYVTPFKSGDSWRLGIKALIDNPADGAKLRYTLRDASGETYRALECGISQSEAYIDCGSPRLWDGRRDPYLYTLSAEIVLADGSVSDNLDVNVGFREFSIDSKEGAVLNGRKIKLRGLCRHQDRAGMGNAITEKEHDEDIAIILESGANALRLAHYQQAPYFYDLCDKNGILVWAEIPVISEFSLKKQQNAKQQLLELIKQNYNHPSIFCWGIQNEITLATRNRKGLEEALRELNSLAKSVDSTRYTTCAQVSMLEISSSLNGITDILGYNHYFGWYSDTCDAFGKWLDAWHSFNPEKKFCISEYGADAVPVWHSENPAQGDYTEEYQCLFHEKYLAEINSREWLWGSFVWNTFDFGSVIRKEGGTEGINNKGLVTYDRKHKKDAFWFYKASWSDEPVLHICSKGFVNRKKGESKIKVYSNQPEVTLAYGDKEIKLGGKTMFEFTVPVEQGENTFTAKSGELADSIVINGVPEADESYNLPPEMHSFVRDWHTAAQDDGSTFGLDDRLGDLLQNEEAQSLVRARFGNRLDMLFSPLAKPVGAIKVGTAIKLAKRAGLPESYASLAEGYLKTIRKNK